MGIKGHIYVTFSDHARSTLLWLDEVYLHVHVPHLKKEKKRKENMWNPDCPAWKKKNSRWINKFNDNLLDFLVASWHQGDDRLEQEGLHDLWEDLQLWGFVYSSAPGTKLWTLDSEWTMQVHSNLHDIKQFFIKISIMWKRNYYFIPSGT